MLSMLLAAFLQTGSQSTDALAPTGKWNVEYADNMCVLSRSYGTADKPLILGFKPAPMSDRMQLVLISAGPMGRMRYSTAQVAIQSGLATKHPALTYSTRDSRLRVTTLDLNRSDLAAIGTDGRLSLTTDGKSPRTFLLPRFDIGWKGLEACEADLLQVWGMTAAAVAAIAVKPKPLMNLAAYISDSDYPDEAVRRREQGASGVRFTVGADGKPRDCHAVEPSGSALLDQATCRVITTRAQFKPALDHAGKPVPCLYYTRIRWILASG